ERFERPLGEHREVFRQRIGDCLWQAWAAVRTERHRHGHFAVAVLEERKTELDSRVFVRVPGGTERKASASHRRGARESVAALPVLDLCVDDAPLDRPPRVTLGMSCEHRGGKLSKIQLDITALISIVSERQRHTAAVRERSVELGRDHAIGPKLDATGDGDRARGEAVAFAEPRVPNGEVDLAQLDDTIAASPIDRHRAARDPGGDAACGDPLADAVEIDAVDGDARRAFATRRQKLAFGAHAAAGRIADRDLESGRCPSLGIETPGGERDLPEPARGGIRARWPLDHRVTDLEPIDSMTKALDPLVDARQRFPRSV